MDHTKNNDTFNTLTFVITAAIITLFPLFFLPFAQEYFTTHKFYLITGGALVLLAVSTIGLLFKKKISWAHKPYDNAMILCVVAVALSVLIGSTNKIEAVFVPHYGFAIICGLTIFYFYLSRQTETQKQYIMQLLSGSAVMVSILAILFFFKPFTNASLPFYLVFLKNPFFTTVGTPLEMILFLGFFLIYGLSTLFSQTEEHEQKINPFIIIVTVSSFCALLLTIYAIMRPQPNGAPLFILPPFRLSWYAAVEILKNPLTALFGVGIANFSTLFSSVKDILYNQSPLWQIQTFNQSRSAILHIFTETGLVGIIAFSLILLPLMKQIITNSMNNTVNKALIIYTLVILLLFPLSLSVLFLLYVLIAKITVEDHTHDNRNTDSHVDLSNILPLHIGLILLSILFIGISGYVLGRGYLAEYYFKKSLDGFATNNGQQVYENQRKALIFNPYLDRYHINFAKTNFLIANNLASKKKEELTENDRQTIAQAIQAAILESKAAVSLNPNRAANWENLAIIYRNVLNIAQGADTWTISSYQRAIVLDPSNPSYRLNLGGVYYSLGNYDEAIKLFDQSISLKPDWSNAHYNMAWARYQKADYQQAASEMQNVISLLDPLKDESDYKQAQTDLKKFKAKIPQEKPESTATSSAVQNNKKLSLPTPPAANISPKIELPKTASPEAR